ncbi:MAG: pseudaminic acid cytidylyltransferase [Sphingobacteriaceae bacterium]|nr:pseudaminic acid cytidylyltransferase [Cytophagaceae bacterium]
MNLAIITARGGSKRIPRKNIRPFLGRPILAYPIEAALNSGLFAEVMVSTDDEEIADIARSFGATVPFLRSAATSDDRATTSQVLEEVLAGYEGVGQPFGYACCLYPTAPFVSETLLAQALEKLRAGRYDCVFPVQRFGFPVQRALVFEGDRLQWLQPENALVRSQDLAPAFHDTGQFYFFDVAAFRQSGRLLSDNTSGLEISELQAHDIDTEDDWRVAEFKFKLAQL